VTGLHTGHTAVRDNEGPFGAMPLGPSDVTVAEVLKQAGYTTAVIGKWDMAGPDAVGIPNHHGFDYSFGYLHSSHAHNHYPEHLWRNGQKVMLEGNRSGQGTQYSHDLFTQEALAYIERERNRTFFLYLAYTLPHAELTVPEDSLKPYLGKFPEKPFLPKKAQWSPGVYSPQENPNAAFAGMISHLDRDVGRLLTKLEELGLDRDTLVIFTSDNGPHREGGADPQFFGGSGPLRGIKRDLYEGGIRIPFIARWPGKIESGTTSDHVSAFWDILPTCAELAGANTPEEIDGLSMVPSLLGRPGEQEKHAFLYWEFQEKQAVRMGDWKGVRPEGEDGGLELYDLKRDIGEQQDLSRKHPEIIARIEKIMKTSHDVPRRLL
jgi:arylsulfatase A-like enzyme